MINKKNLIKGLFFVFISISISFASYARIESMGKNAAYIMDDISIFDNPANINIFPNFLIGEFGSYLHNDLTPGVNLDPQQPWFGGIFSIALGKEKVRDPRFTIGGALNRIDENLYRFLPDSVYQEDRSVASGYKSIVVPKPVTNFDGFLGFTLPNGNSIGTHIYIAHQQGASKEGENYNIDADAFSSIVKLDAGINWRFSPDIDGEISAGLARLQFGPESRSFIDSELMSGMINARLFSTWSLINGEIVPILNYSFIQAPGIDERNLITGMGVNVALDRGFFWLGADYVYTVERSHDWSYNNKTGVRIFTNSDVKGNWDVKEQWGGRVSFGIERNIWWDWFVIRVGGMKVLTYVDCQHNDKNQVIKNKGMPAAGYSTLCPQDGNYFYSNPNGDGTWGDHVGFGIGINVEEKLKIDATIAEDVIFRNPFQGTGRLLSRVSATYSF